MLANSGLTRRNLKRATRRKKKVGRRIVLVASISRTFAKLVIAQERKRATRMTRMTRRVRKERRKRR
jgi:hypothetical protein